jgi:Nif-specific regulatory protein
MEHSGRRAPVSISQPEWQEWGALPWLSRSAPGSSETQLWLRLVESAARMESRAALLRQQLPEIGSEFAAQWVCVLKRGEEWERIAEFGRQPFASLPTSILSDALDRNAAGHVAIEGGGDAGGWNFLAAPLHREAESGEILALCGRTLSTKSLSHVLVAARALGWGCEVADRLDAARQRIDRLRTTLQIASQLGSVRESKPLLELIAAESARLLDADRASIFIWDREHHEVVACPALGFEGNVLRIPDNSGIVGECLHTGRAIRVDQAYRDPRFNREVDVKSGYTTRNLMCVPLLDEKRQRIGAFEAINKLHGAFTEEDEESLSELGVQAAVALAGTRERERLVRRHRQLTEQVSQEVEIIGESPAIVALRSTIDRLAATDLPVLLLGESGTGKEVVAQALHYQGPRRDAPFVAVNCAAVAETLLESELFGHEKGAFTDARELRQGKFEVAEGGTLFLDEIGDMSAAGQGKLLRVLEQKVITRVGGSQPIRINVRVIAATNVNLAQAVREKKFREDLYYRLSVVALELPPLRDRPEDTLPLAEHFLAHFCAQARRPALLISPEARMRLQAHPWPGNVRELRNLMERIAFLCSNDRVEASDLAFILSPDADAATAATDLSLSEATARFQQEYIRRMIRRVGGNMTVAARLLGLHRSNLYRKMGQLDMSEAKEEVGQGMTNDENLTVDS